MIALLTFKTSLTNSGASKAESPDQPNELTNSEPVLSLEAPGGLGAGARGELSVGQW